LATGEGCNTPGARQSFDGEEEEEEDVEEEDAFEEVSWCIQ